MTFMLCPPSNDVFVLVLHYAVYQHQWCCCFSPHMKSRHDALTFIMTEWHCPTTYDALVVPVFKPSPLQVFVPLIAHCIRPQVSEDRPGGYIGLGLTSSNTLGSLGGAGHAGMNAVLSALLTPGGLAVLRRSPDELIRVLRSPGDIETPRLVWGPHCRDELEELLKQVEGIFLYMAYHCELAYRRDDDGASVDVLVTFDTIVSVFRACSLCFEPMTFCHVIRLKTSLLWSSG